MKLFDRSSSPLQLTKAGEYYLDYVNKCIAIDNELQEKIDNLKNFISGTIKLGIPLQMQSELVPELLSPFMEKHPQIDVIIQDDASPSLEKHLAGNSIDCAIIYTQKDRRTSGLSYIHLEDEPVYMICGKGHPLVNGRISSTEHPIEISIDDILDDYFYLLNKGFIVRMLADDFFIENRFVPNKIMSMTSMEAILNTIIMKKGIAFMPQYMINAFRKADNLAYLKTGNSNEIIMNLALAFNKGKIQTAATSAFLDFVKGHYGIEKAQ